MKTIENHKSIFDWTILATFLSAYVYFCAWLFEFSTCRILNVPITLIDLTSANTLFDCGILIMTIAIISLVALILYLLLSESDYKFWLGFFIILSAVLNGTYYYINHEITFEVI